MDAHEIQYFIEIDGNIICPKNKILNVDIKQRKLICINNPINLFERIWDTKNLDDVIVCIGRLKIID